MKIVNSTVLYQVRTGVEMSRLWLKQRFRSGESHQWKYL